MRVWNRADDNYRIRDFVVIAISLTDSGMYAAILKRAFEPFCDDGRGYGNKSSGICSLRAALLSTLNIY
jgi:hypothetical protein